MGKPVPGTPLAPGEPLTAALGDPGLPFAPGTPFWAGAPARIERQETHSLAAAPTAEPSKGHSRKEDRRQQQKERSTVDF